MLFSGLLVQIENFDSIPIFIWIVIRFLYSAELNYQKRFPPIVDRKGPSRNLPTSMTHSAKV